MQRRSLPLRDTRTCLVGVESKLLEAPPEALIFLFAKFCGHRLNIIKESADELFKRLRYVVHGSPVERREVYVQVYGYLYLLLLALKKHKDIDASSTRTLES